jgi:hypothetical protein
MLNFFAQIWICTGSTVSNWLASRLVLNRASTWLGPSCPGWLVLLHELARARLFWLELFAGSARAGPSWLVSRLIHGNCILNFLQKDIDIFHISRKVSITTDNNIYKNVEGKNIVKWDLSSVTSGKRAFGLDPLVPASIWAGTKGPATSPQNGLDVREALVPARNVSLVPVWDTNRD